MGCKEGPSRRQLHHYDAPGLTIIKPIVICRGSLQQRRTKYTEYTSKEARRMCNQDTVSAATSTMPG